MKEKISKFWEQANKDWQRPILGNLIVVLGVIISILASGILFDVILGVSDSIRVTASAISAMLAVMLVHYNLKKRGW